jgi:hypothetical protein
MKNQTAAVRHTNYLGKCPGLIRATKAPVRPKFPIFKHAHDLEQNVCLIYEARTTIFEINIDSKSAVRITACSALWASAQI